VVHTEDHATVFAPVLSVVCTQGIEDQMADQIEVVIRA
jgi:hypothetical protein